MKQFVLKYAYVVVFGALMATNTVFLDRFLTVTFLGALPLAALLLIYVTSKSLQQVIIAAGVGVLCAAAADASAYAVYPSVAILIDAALIPVFVSLRIEQSKL